MHVYDPHGCTYLLCLCTPIARMQLTKTVGGGGLSDGESSCNLGICSLRYALDYRSNLMLDGLPGSDGESSCNLGIYSLRYALD
jgi:hypothetical protein